MKILYLHDTLPEYRYGFFVELSKKCDLTIAFTDISVGKKVYGTEVEDSRLNNIKHVILKKNYINDIKVLKKMIFKDKYDCIIIPALDSVNHILLAYYVECLAKRNKITSGLLWEKWRPSPQYQPVKRRLKEFVQSVLIHPLMKNTDIFLCPGKKTKEYLINNGADIHNIYHFHDSSVCSVDPLIDIRSRYHIPQNISIVLYFGRLVEYKGADVLIKAFSKTDSEFQKNHFLLIAGSGPMEEECRQIANRLGIENYCFAGLVEPQLRASFFRDSDIFVLPVKITNGKIEAWGLTINEAIQFDNIIIATDAVGSAYELVNENNGFMVKENNVQELADALMNSCSEKLENTSRLEAEKVKKQYTYETMAQDIVDAFSCNKESRGY